MDLAVGRLQKTRDQPQRRGLAAAGWSEQADQLPMADPQRDIIDHRKRAKPLGQAAQINGRQSNSSNALLCRDQRPGLLLVYSISTKYGVPESLSASDFDRIELADRVDCLSHCGRRHASLSRAKEQQVSVMSGHDTVDPNRTSQWTWALRPAGEMTNFKTRGRALLQTCRMAALRT